MEWTLAGLFVLSAVLLIISIIKSSHAAKVEQNEVNQIHVSTMKEINAIQDSIRNIGLDIEVVKEESGIQLSSEEQVFMREILDLYKRNYSMESIAGMKQVPMSHIVEMLAPYQQSKKDEGSQVAHAN